MKKLYIIRHAKSSWKDMGLRDFDRQLNKRGKHNSKFMGKLLHKNGVIPDIIISSPAKRASDTAHNIANALAYPIEQIEYESDIYEASGNTLLKIIKSINDEYSTAFVIGHNPSLNMLVDYLLPKEYIDNIVTTGIVELRLNITQWSELSPDTTTMLSFEYPKKYVS